MAHAARSPDSLFTQLGCSGCHAPGARFHAQVDAARGKDAEPLARWIQHPERFQPGTPMPSSGALLSEPEALSLAPWIKARTC